MRSPDPPEGPLRSSNDLDGVEVFRVEMVGDPATLALIGELDIAGVPALAEAIATVSATGDGLVFDLARLTFIDSSGLNEMLKALRDHAGPIRLVSPQPNVLRVLDITG